MYRALDVDPMLTTLIYGEGSVNDATSIVMYETFASFVEEGVSNEGWAEAAAKFSEELFGSIFFGILVGVLGTYVFRVVHIGWLPPALTRLCACCPRSREHDVSGVSKKLHLLAQGSAAAAAAAAAGEKTSLLRGAPSSPDAAAEAHKRALLDNQHGEDDEDGPMSDIAVLAAAALSNAREQSTGRNARSSFAIFDAPDLTSIPLDMARAISRDREVKPDSSVFAQCAYILLMGYVAYMASEALHLSGVVAVLFTGISLNHFVRPLLTPEGKDFSEGTIRVLAEIADLTTFFQVGLDAALTFGTRDGIDTQGDAALLGFIVVGCYAGRAVAIFGLSSIINYYRRTPIPFNYQAMLWHAGLRGAGAYAFTLAFPTENRDVLIDATAGLVLITVLLCGATTGSMLSWSAIPWGHNFDPAEDHLHPAQHEEGPIRRASIAAAQAERAQGAGDGARKPSSRTGAGEAEWDEALRPNYKSVLVHGARVYVPVGGARAPVAEDAAPFTGAGPAPLHSVPTSANLRRREKALSWINRLDTRIRFWVSGVVRED
jgi:NhaP-type Na+/H+ or K+/H+ antiporter